VPVKGVSELQEESRGYRPATLGRVLPERSAGNPKSVKPAPL